MRKKLLLFLSFMLSLWSYGQFTFPTVTGPISVSGGTAENVPINDAANAAAVPAGLYDSFSVSVDWVSTNYAYASEADLTIITSGGNVTIDPPTTGSAYSEAATTLTFSGSLTSLYDPSVDGLLTLDLNQSWNPSDANWSNIVVTLFEAPTCPDPLDLGITNLTATTVDLGWTEFGTATTWNVEYGAAGFSQGSGAVVNTTSNPHNLTGLTPETVYEFYVQSDCGGTDQSNWVVPFEFTTPPTCPAPTDLAITNLTTTSADLGWTNGSSETAWNVEYGAAGFSQGSGTVVNTTSNPHNLTGLTAETAYEFYVQADCGGTDQSTWAGPFSFYTGYCLPSASGTATYIDNFTTSNGSTNISNLASGHTAGGYFDGTAQAVSSYELGSFDFNAEIVGGTAGFAIWIDWNNDLVFDNVTEKVFNTTGFGNGPFTGTISVPSGTSIGNYRMRITTDWNSSNPSDPCADRNRAEFEDYTLTITATPSCLPPSSLMASNITATSADLGWTNGGSETAWNIEYGPVGFTQGSGGTTVNATTNPHNLTGLTAETAYEFYVQADCGGTDQSTWAGPFAFTTPCNPYSIPYFEGFESGYTHNTNVDGCVIQESELGTQAWTANNTLTSYNRSPRTGDWNAFLRYSNTDWMFIPVQLVGGTSYMMDVYARQDGSTATNAKVEISYGASGNAASMTDVIVAETGVVNNQYQLLSGVFTPVTSGVYYIGIKGIVNGSPWYLSVDDIAIYEAPSCLPTTDLVASNETQTSVDLDWTENNSATTWNIEYGPEGFTPGTGTVITGVTTNPYTVSGLNSSSTYDFYVQSDCGSGDISSIGSGVTATTLCGAVLAPYYEGFESGELPTCYENLSSNTTSTSANNFWKFTGQAGYGAANNGKAAGTFAWSDGSTPTPDSMMLITTEVDLTPLTTPYLGFEWFSNNTDNPGDNVPLIVSIHDGTSWILLDTLRGDSDEWQFASFDLAAYANTVVKVGFMTNQTTTTNDAYYNDILVDEIRIDNCITGQDGTKNVCRLDGTVDLNDNIVTAAMGGGTWHSDGLDIHLNDSIFDYSTLPSGTYEMYYVERFACADTSVATINVYNASTAGEGQTITVCKNEPINLYAALSGNVDIGGDWYDFNGNLLPNSQPTSPSLAAQYNYNYITSNGVCPADTATVEVNVGNCVWAVEEEEFAEISVYPNPTTSVLNIVNPSNTSSLRIEMLDMNGRVVMVENKALNNATEATLTIDHLEKGIYTLRVYNNEGQRTFKIVKQ